MKIDNLSKKALKRSPDNQEKVQNFLKTFENDIIVKNIGGNKYGRDTKYERAINKSS